jgi:hypothetical protein
MLAVLWHVWIGVVLLIVAIVAVIGLVVGFVRKVVAPQYPGRRHPEE